MKKAATLAMSIALAFGLVACGGTAQPGAQDAPEEAVVSEEVQEDQAQEEQAQEGSAGEEFDYWSTEIADGLTMKDTMAMMAKPDTDIDAFTQSELGQFVASSQSNFNAFGAIDDESIAPYWQGVGMTREVHDVDDADHQWVSLVPSDYDASKTYPLLFVWHGNNNPVPLAETYGFGEVAAQKGWIVVLPWAANDDVYLAEFDRILAEMEQSYSIDTARIYSTGFSKGGRVSARLALERADVLAAAAPCGTTAAASFYNPDGTELELSSDGPQQLSAEDFANASGFVPVQFFGGELDVFGAMPYDADYKIDGVNGWLGLMGNDNLQSLDASEKLIAGADDETEQSIGLSFDQTEVISQDGTTYHVGSYLDADGNASIRIVECDGAIHWPTPYMGQIAVDFLAQYSK